MSPMEPGRWESLEELFFAALDRPEADRAAFLARARPERPELVAEVETLLAAHEQTQGMRIEASLLNDDARDEEVERAGSRTGPWQFVRRIGQGGMGDVWLAERVDGGFHQLAAIKFVRSGHRPPDLLRRFRRERQLLARLAHPNIAKLLDGGTTEDGEPYLAMEYIEGETITAWCDARRLPVRERLRVFAQVCEAVRFAHANLVVHRDIKPANIMVTADGRLVLLDFGIAKLLQREDDDGEQTLVGERVLTPEYAAPEQLRGEPATTATDVWGLGVLLYELLTGERPFRVSGISSSEVERRVLETEPRRLSEVARTRHDPAATPETPATRRDTTPAELSSELRGDLDAIVAFALRKEPERRYRSAEQLGEDIDRFLRGLPVQARPDALRYRAAKYVQRHRVAVAATTAFVLSVLAFAIVTTVQARRIGRERDRSRAEAAKSERALDVLVSLFKLSDPRTVPGGDTLRIGDVLRIAESKLNEVEDQPEIQARLWETLASIHLSRSELRDQRQALLRGIAAARRAGSEDLVLRMNRSLATVTSRLDGAHAALPLLRANLRESELRYGPGHELVAAALAEFASITGTDQERLAMLDRSLAIRRANSPAGSIEVATSLNLLAGYWAERNGLERALSMHQQARAMMIARLPVDHPDVLQVGHNIAMTLGQLGRFSESLRLHEELLPIRRRVLGPRTTAVAASLTGMGFSLAQLGRYGPAADSLAEALEILGQVLGPEGHAARNVERALTLALARAGREAEAKAHLASVLEHARSTPGGPTPDVWLLRIRLAGLAVGSGRGADLPAMHEALAQVRRARSRYPRALVDALVEMGSVSLALAGSAPSEDAEAYFAEAAVLADSAIAAGHPSLDCANCGWLAARARAGRPYDRAALRASWEHCRGWGYLPPTLVAPVEHVLTLR